MAHKQSKATKKFEKNKLTSTLEKRKKFAQIKQRHQIKAKKRIKADKRAGKESETDGSGLQSSLRAGEADHLDDDKYFQDGIQIPDAAKLTKRDKSSSKMQTGK